MVSNPRRGEPEGVALTRMWGGVGDRGRAVPKGRGLALMHGLSDRVDIVGDVTGTRVTLSYRLEPLEEAG